MSEDLKVGDRTIDRVTREELIELLNGDLSREYQAIITYIQYAASVTGPYRTELKNFFAAESCWLQLSACWPCWLWRCWLASSPVMTPMKPLSASAWLCPVPAT